ncbi:MAG: 4Fe-4S binding protein [Deltaproteobacteria bacterium]
MNTTRILRRASQTIAFAVFVFLFLNTEYKDNDVLPYAVNLFLRLDPLMAGAASLAGRALISLVWPALLTLALTVVLGRFFCGWVCPLGAVIDAADAAVFRKTPRKTPVPSSWRRVKFLVLFFLAVSSLFTLQWVFLFDPISILIRTFTVSVYPAMNLVLHGIFDAFYRLPGPIPRVSEPVYGFLKSHFLAFEQPVFRTSAFVGVLFLGILAAETFQRRFWCRNLCPLGGLLALAGRFGVVRRRIDAAGCTRCGLCESSCRMGAIGAGAAATDHGECVECMDCQAVCPEEVIHFTGKEGRAPVAVDLTRRGVVASVALGAVTVPFFRVEAHGKAPSPSLIRPPGALAEREFLARCTRCGECMRVCIANGLQPTWFEAGIEGMWSPVLVPRIGYCEYNCTLCGQVCPTGAIRRLPLLEKRKVRLGLAWIDRSRCLPWKGESDCIVCEEHCPTGSKAIVLREERTQTQGGEWKTFQKPYIEDALCVGCGICETKCPLPDRAAIRVTSRGETRSTGVLAR